MIRNDATMLECKKYAMYYMVGGKRSYAHYRYDRYYKLFEQVMTGRSVGESVYHLDLGCGPGLFTWVVRDYFHLHAVADVRFNGYDHAPNMIKIARKIWKRLNVEEKYKCYHDVKKVIAAGKQASLSSGFVIVTFGHVLIQTRDNKTAQDTFARIVATVAESAKCIIIASDAHSGDNDDSFREACRDLKMAIARHEFVIDMCFHAGESKMYGEIQAKV